MINREIIGGEGKLEKQVEEEQYSSRIALHFSRHGEREKDPNKSTYELLLTPHGRNQALNKGRKRGGATPTSVAFGSEIQRAQEFAGYDMAGAHQVKDISGEETLEELKEKLDKGLAFGHRLAKDERLGFHFYNDEYEKAVRQAYKENHGLSFFVYESDKLAEELGDQKSTTYTGSASNVAKFLQKYVAIAPNYDQLVKDQSKKEKYGNILERFIGSHGGVIDCFFCKVVEEIKGDAERDKLVKVLGNQGFDEGEGFEIEIDTLLDRDYPQVRLVYEKRDEEGKILFSFNEIISSKIIKGINKEGERKKEKSAI